MAEHRNHPTESTSQTALLSSGMSNGLHRQLAVLLSIIAILFGLIFSAWASLALSLFFLAAAIGLLGEAFAIHCHGEVRVREAKSTRFVVLRREESPMRFKLYIVLYTILGGFCLLVSLVPLMLFLLTLVR